jgi:hypothetical protein
MKMIMEQKLEQDYTPAENRWPDTMDYCEDMDYCAVEDMDYRRREYIDTRSLEDNLEPLLSPEGVQIGWYDPVTDQEYPY